MIKSLFVKKPNLKFLEELLPKITIYPFSKLQQEIEEGDEELK